MFIIHNYIHTINQLVSILSLVGYVLKLYNRREYNSDEVLYLRGEKVGFRHNM